MFVFSELEQKFRIDLQLVLSKKKLKEIAKMSVNILELSFKEIDEHFPEQRFNEIAKNTKRSYCDKILQEHLERWIKTNKIPGEFSLAYLEPLGGAIRNCDADQADSVVCGSSIITSEGRTTLPSVRAWF